MPERLGLSSLDDLVHRDAPGNHGQVSGQRAFTPEIPQDGEVVLQDFDEDVGTEVLDIGRIQRNAARMRSVLDYMDEQADKAIDEVLPSAEPALQAIVQYTFVDLSESQGTPFRRLS
jgi:hypothetical protein